MDHGPHQRQAPFRIDRTKQLQDIYVFEQKLREGAAEVEKTRKKFQALMFSIVVLNGVAVWHALRWTLSEGTFWNLTFTMNWNSTFSLLCAYLPVVLSGGSMCWIIFYYYQHVDDTATYVARCNSVLRSYRTYYCPNTGKLVVLRNPPSHAPSSIRSLPLPAPPSSASPPSVASSTSPPSSSSSSSSSPSSSAASSSSSSSASSSVLSPPPRPALTQRHVAQG